MKFFLFVLVVACSSPAKTARPQSSATSVPQHDDTLLQILRPGAHWTLDDGFGFMLVEVLDVRTKGDVTLIRLRWRYGAGSSFDEQREGAPRTIGIGPRGTWLLWDDGPTIADPPQVPADGAGGPYYTRRDGNVACFGTRHDYHCQLGNPPDPAQLDDCSGEMCLDHQGVLSIHGEWAPDGDQMVRAPVDPDVVREYRNDYPDPPDPWNP